MGVIKFDRDFETLFNWDTDDNPTTEQDYQNAVKNWTETEKNIVDTLLWQPTTEYATGNIVKTPSLPSQYVLRCTETGTSGSTEPSYSGAGAGDTVTDGSVEWVIVSLATGNAADVDASNIGVNAEVDNSEAWGNAIGGGAIAEDDGRLVTGDTVHAVTSVMETNIATNTEAIEDNTENIAINTETIAQNTTDIDIAEKRIGNIEKLLQGNLYDYQTDSDSAYTKTVPAGAMPYASLEQIGGKTLVWNQTLDLSMLRGNQTAYGLTSERTDNGIRLYGAFTSYVNVPVIYGWDNAVIGHRYLITNTPISEALTLRLTQNGGYVNWQENTPFTATNTHTYFGIRPLTLNVNFDVTWTPQIFDLTLLFGAGNEPTTYAEFQQMFPASYYSYNAGQLLSAGVTEVVSKGKNKSLISGSVPMNDNVAIANFGENISLPYITVSFQCTNVTFTNDTAAVFNFYNDTNNYFLATAIKKADGTAFAKNMSPYTGRAYITLTNRVVRGVKFYTYTTSYAKWSGVFSDVQVEFSSAMTDYSAPFTISTPIPAEIQALEGYGWSAGNVYNYIDYERKKFVKCVDRVDLGTLTWTYSSSFQTSGITTTIKKPATTVKANVLCVNYTCTPYSAYFTDDEIAVSANGVVYIKDTSYTDASTFTSAMNGVMLYYELATPIETDISAYLTDDNLISVESGGTLTFPNSNGDDYRIPVPSAETYMVDLQEAI